MVDPQQIRQHLIDSRDKDPERFAQSPLPYPQEFDAHIDRFAVAAHLAFNGDVETARELISSIDGESLMDWYDTIAQHVADIRYTLITGNPPRRLSGKGKHQTQSPARVAAIAKRDKYRCGYCGMRLVEPQILKRIQVKVGRDVFPSKGNKKESSNRDYHGIWVTTAITLDHVVPYAVSSDDTIENLISSCWSCNFGKYDYTCEELELSPPAIRVPSNESWSGLRDVVEWTPLL